MPVPVSSLFKTLLRGIFIILNVLAILWLAGCKWVSLHDVSRAPSYYSLLSFTCIFALLSNMFFIFFWLFSRKRKWLCVFSLLMIMACWSIAKPLFGLHLWGGKPEGNEVPGIKIMTWNVHLFDLGEWTRDKTSRAKIIDLIKNENPDILCLEEFYMDENAGGEPYTNIIRQLGYPYFKFSKEFLMRKSRMTTQAQQKDKILTGHAIFSKYPLQDDITYTLGNTHYNMLSVNVVVDSDRIFNLNVTHLASVRLNDQDISYIEELKEKGSDVEQNAYSKSLLAKMKLAFSQRAKQANLIDSLKDESDYPLVICGDFNDVPGSYVYTKVKGDLSDAFTAKGWGFGRTYRNIMPTLRIDYILYDNHFMKVESYHSPDVKLSDHLPVVTDFSFRP